MRSSKAASVIISKLRLLVEQFDQPGRSFAFSIIVYFTISLIVRDPWKPSDYPYFSYLADAFLHGQLNLRIIPPFINDLVIYQGNYYLYWPPFPAILLAPLVKIFSVQLKDILITIFLGAINVALVSRLLRSGNEAGLYRLSKFQRGLLIMFFAFGTVHLTLAPLGGVWFTAQIIGFLCVVITYLIALNWNGWRAFALAGIAMGCAIATRNHLAFAGIWPAWYLIRKHYPSRLRHLFAYMAIGLIPVALAIALLLSYNAARFDNPFDVGLDYHKMSPFFANNYKLYRAFHLHYLPVNFYYQYIYYPFPARWETLMGGSLFLLSPLFIAAFLGIWKGRREFSTWLLVLTIVAVDIPILLLMGTGWVQFGPRYSLDFTVPLLLLTAMGVEYWQNQRAFLLVLISVAHYLAGVLLLGGL